MAMRQKSTARVVMSVAASLVALATGTATAALPSGMHDVKVTAGNTQSGIDAFVHPAGAISGQVTLHGTTTGVATRVSVLKSGQEIAASDTDNNGNYLVGGLRAGDYVVCAQSPAIVPSGSGTLRRCYPDVGWNSGPVPSTVQPVTVLKGQVTPSINIAVRPAAGISGTVRDSASNPLESISVLVANPDTGATFSSYTGADGTYVVPNLPNAQNGYIVCFRPVTYSGTGTGLLPRCYRGVSWNGGAYPANADRVMGSPGLVQPGIGAKLAVAGAITGHLKDAATNGALKYAEVRAFTAKGRQIGYATTDPNGDYLIPGLGKATADVVCANPFTVGSTRYLGECWRNVAWGGNKLPAGTRDVAVTPGSTTPGINFALDKKSLHLGSISGRVTDFNTGDPLGSVSLTAYDSHGNSVANGSTVTDGYYTISFLKPSATGYYVCADSTFSASSPGPIPPTGWAPRCFKDVPYLGLKPPSAAKLIPLAPDQNRIGVGIALQAGGAITGTIQAYGGGGLSGEAGVFSKSGRLVGGYTGDNATTGAYSIASLAPATYHVCFVPFVAEGEQGHLPQCYDQRPWSGQP
jgi:hypothetical protein